MITGNLRGLLVSGKRESDLETYRNALRTGHGDEQRMEISAVALLGVAGIEDITAAPTGARFVVAHGSENEVVNGACFLQELRFSLRDLGCDVGGQA